MSYQEVGDLATVARLSQNTCMQTQRKNEGWDSASCLVLHPGAKLINLVNAVTNCSVSPYLTLV